MAVTLAAPVLAVSALTGPAVAAPKKIDDQCVTEILVNKCRVWLGARANNYPGVGSSQRAQLEAHEERIGRRVDIAHTYAPIGKLPLQSRDERYFVNRADTILFQNWKPARRWDDVTSGKLDANIKKAAENIKSVAPKKIFLTLNHEPENNVSKGGAGSCDTRDGGFGSTADFREMWRYIHKRFAKLGVDNVVWVMDYMNYKRWDCMVGQLYPGDDVVDWVMFNAYGQGRTDNFDYNVGHFIDVLEEVKGPNRNPASKPRGIVEWSIKNASQTEAKNYYEQAREAIEKNKFGLNVLMIFDSPGPAGDPGFRVAYDDKGRYDGSELAAYRKLANIPQLGGNG